MRGQEFLQRLEQEVVVGDGAMGSMLSSRGVPWNACFEAVNLTRPELVKALHLEYVAAGSEVVETNTFGANRNKLAAADQGDRVREVNAAAVRLARSVVPENIYVVGSVGPYGAARIRSTICPTASGTTHFGSRLRCCWRKGWT